MVIVTTSGLVTTIDWTGVRAGPVSNDSWWASKLAATALASQGVPLWNLRLGRMVIVHTVPSVLDVTDWARLGWGVRCRRGS